MAGIKVVKGDDDNGDRGDVAPPAIHMPRAMNSRCMSCGRDMTVHQLKAKMCDCGAAMDDMNDTDPSPVADTDAQTGTRPAINDKVGGTHQAPPPPGAPLRMAAKAKKKARA